MGKSLEEKLIELYLGLKQIVKIPKTLIAKNCVEDHLGFELMLKNPNLYEKLRKELFIFYVLFSQNTHNKFTSSAVLKLVEFLKKKNYTYEIEEFKAFFYKHKEDYLVSLKLLSELIEISERKKILFKDLLKIKRVGHKTASLIYNEFFEPGCFPVVDVNCLNGFQKIAEKYDLAKVKSSYELFIYLSNLSNYCDLNIGFELSNLLYAYNKLDPKLT